jgi:hypothetical protein
VWLKIAGLAGKPYSFGSIQTPREKRLLDPMLLIGLSLESEAGFPGPCRTRNSLQYLIYLPWFTRVGCRRRRPKCYAKMSNTIPFDGHADLFSAVGHRLHNTAGAPHQNQRLRTPPIGLGLPGGRPPPTSHYGRGMAGLQLRNGWFRI